MSEMPFFADRDRRSMREKLEDLEEGQTVRVVTKTRDVLTRVEEDTLVREDVDVTERIVEVFVKVYGDTEWDHYTSTISWWEPGPVLFGQGDFDRVERLEVR